MAVRLLLVPESLGGLVKAERRPRPKVPEGAVATAHPPTPREHSNPRAGVMPSVLAGNLADLGTHELVYL